jgi:hypothetical protein
MTQAVNVLLKCRCIETIKIESVVHIPKPGELATCSKHGKEIEILKVSTPYSLQNKTSKYK